MKRRVEEAKGAIALDPDFPIWSYVKSWPPTYQFLDRLAEAEATF